MTKRPANRGTPAILGGAIRVDKRVVRQPFQADERATWPPIAQDAAAFAKRVRTETSAEAVIMEVDGKVVL